MPYRAERSHKIACAFGAATLIEQRIGPRLHQIINLVEPRAAGYGAQQWLHRPRERFDIDRRGFELPRFDIETKMGIVHQHARDERRVYGSRRNQVGN